MPGNAFTTLPVCLLLSLGALIGPGCGSSNYQLISSKSGQPMVPMELKAVAGPIELTVTGLITFDSPGAWKREAFWDEYLVRLTNHSGESLTISGAYLHDILARSVASGSDPWELDKAGRKQERYLISLGLPASAFASAHPRKTLAAQVGGGATGLALATVPVAAPLLIYGTPVIVMAASPVLAVNKLLIDPKNRKLVQAEFNRRCLRLPIELAPGASISGSVFFPLTPGPEHLSLKGRQAGQIVEVSVALPGLAGLHYTQMPDREALQRARSDAKFQPGALPGTKTKSTGERPPR
jgi:hypothetical protein